MGMKANLEITLKKLNAHQDSMPAYIKSHIYRICVEIRGSVYGILCSQFLKPE